MERVAIPIPRRVWVWVLFLISPKIGFREEIDKNCFRPDMLSCLIPVVLVLLTVTYHLQYFRNIIKIGGFYGEGPIMSLTDGPLILTLRLNQST